MPIQGPGGLRSDFFQFEQSHEQKMTAMNGKGIHVYFDRKGVELPSGILCLTALRIQWKIDTFFTYQINIFVSVRL